MKFETTARITGGRLHTRNRPRLEAAIRQARDGEYVITIERVHATRSPAANAYYWAVIIHHLSEHTGFTPLECHEYLKARFLPRTLAVTGENGALLDERVVGGTTATLNTIQFGDYLREIREWLHDNLGVHTPAPDPHWRETSEAA